MMKQSKDPFEVAFEEQEDSPPDSPVLAHDDIEPQTSVVAAPTATTTATASATTSSSIDVPDDELNDFNINTRFAHPSVSAPPSTSTSAAAASAGKAKDEDEEEEEEENMEVAHGKLPSSADPDKMAKMQSILSQFTEEQMSRYESFRRSGFQKANMKKLLASITGSPKISVPMTIVVSGIAKMFVGELVEIGRVVMTERKETGPIRPCHIREAYRRLKLEGKVPKRSVGRLFR